MSRSTRLAALLLSMGTLFAATLLAPAPAHAQKDKKPPKTAPVVTNKPDAIRILMFPTDAPEGAGEQLADPVARVIQRRLTEKGAYNVTEFLPSLTSIRRALTERTLDPKDVKAPYDRGEKPKKIARFLGFTQVILASINEYQYDEAKRRVTVDLSIRIIDFSGEKPVIKMSAQTVTSPENPPKDLTEAKIGLDFVRDLTEKMMAEILKPKAEPAKEEKKP